MRSLSVFRKRLDFEAGAQAARRMVVRLGHWAVEMIEYTGGVAVLGFETLRWMMSPQPRRGLIVSQMRQIGIRSLPVSGVIVFLLGMVIAFQTAYQVRSLGGEILIPGLIAISITRELGPMITALIIAGRVGAAITAEIGTMNVTEQVDALEALATSPVKYLVVPRFVAMVVMIPVLTIYTDILGMFGGYVVSVTKLSIGHVAYWNVSFDALAVSDVFSGLFKSFMFATIICFVSCFEGFRVQGGAEGVGKATMRSVVASFFFIVLADFGFTVVFYFLPL